MLYIFCAVIALSSVSNQQVGAQEFGHTDVFFDYGPEKIEIDNGTFTSFFPTRGISQRFQTLPGFASETDAGLGIPPGDQLVYNVLSELQYWVQGQLEPSLVQDVQIRVRNRPSSTPETIVGSASEEQPGSFDPPQNRIGQAAASGDFHSDLQWFLESNDAESQPPEGTYAMRMSLSTDRTAIADSDPFYFIWHYGAEADDFEAAVEFFESQLIDDPSILGDFDGSGVLDVPDIDILTMESASGNNHAEFDLTGDGNVDSSDVDHWVIELKNTWIGDANVDDEFNSSDLVAVFQAGKYETEASAKWSEGDWNGDGSFNSTDMVTAFTDGGYEMGTRGEAQMVPESLGSSTILFCLIAFVLVSLSRQDVRCVRA